MKDRGEDTMTARGGNVNQSFVQDVHILLLLTYLVFLIYVCMYLYSWLETLLQRNATVFHPSLTHTLHTLLILLSVMLLLGFLLPQRTWETWTSYHPRNTNGTTPRRGKLLVGLHGKEVRKLFVRRGWREQGNKREGNKIGESEQDESNAL